MPTTHIWKGDLAAVAQVDTVTITAYDAATTYKLTINSRIVSTPGVTDATGTATALAAAWNASTQPEFAEVTASSNAAVVTLRADTPGKPFTATSSVAGGTGTIGAVTNITPNQGPNVWMAGNFDSGALPVDTDTVIFESSSVDSLYELDQNAVDLAALTIKQSSSGKSGLPRTNPSGYVEYRDQYLKLTATTIKIGEGEGNGSGRIKLDTQAVITTLNIFNKGGRAETGIPCVLWKGSNAGNVVNLLRGDLGVAFFGGETATIATLNVGSASSQITDPLLVCGPGTILTTVNVYGGTIELNSAITTLTQEAGVVTVRGTGTIGTWNLNGGIGYHCSDGTITTLKVGATARADFSQDPRPRTVTNCEVYQGGTIYDPNNSVTWTNGILLHL